MALVWTKKKMSASDAQVKAPKGWPVPYLRVTNSGNLFNTLTWFKVHFFAGETWGPSTFGRAPKPIEISVQFRVRIAGVDCGNRTMRVTYKAARPQTGKNTPTTYLHYDPVTLAELRATSYKGHKVEVKRDNNGKYHFTIY